MNKPSPGLSDLPEAELRKMSGPGGTISSRWCSICDRNHRFCRCMVPEWHMRTEGKLGPIIPAPPQIATGPSLPPKLVDQHGRPI